MSGLAAALVSLLILLLMARRDPKRLRASRQSARPMSTAQRRSWAILALLPGVTLAVACGASAVLLCCGSSWTSSHRTRTWRWARRSR